MSASVEWKVADPLAPASLMSPCLIVEDQALIGMALESYFQDEGCAATSLCTCADARRWLGAQTPSAAILDYMLKDGSCTDLARILRSRGVPFVVYSGLPPHAACPELQDVPWISKPATRMTLMGTLLRLIQSRPRPRPAPPVSIKLVSVRNSQATAAGVTQN